MKRLVIDFENENDLYQLLQNVETNEEGNKVIPMLRNGNSYGVRAIVVREEYKIANLDQQLQSLKNGLEALTRGGFSIDLLSRYLRSKGVSKRTFDTVMSGIKEFFYEID